MTRYAWLQKHPTPAAQGGEFHWYPADGDGELRASFAERLPSATPETVLWQLAPELVAWALPFVAVAHDGRRYTGLALAIADDLAQLVPPIAAPWTEETAPPIAARAPVLPDPAAVARALLDGGAAAVGDPAHAGLPRAIAVLERRMPRAVAARVRRGSWIAGEGKRASDRVAELVVAAPESRAGRAWRLACELATPERGIDAVVAAAPEPPTSSDRDDAWVAELNAWGRGKVARDIDELADHVALRVLARLAADRDPAWAIAEARWHALLPAQRRDELLAAIGRRANTLRGMIDG